MFLHCLVHGSSFGYPGCSDPATRLGHPPPAGRNTGAGHAAHGRGVLDRARASHGPPATGVAGGRELCGARARRKVVSASRGGHATGNGLDETGAIDRHLPACDAAHFAPVRRHHVPDRQTRGLDDVHAPGGGAVPDPCLYDRGGLSATPLGSGPADSHSLQRSPTSSLPTTWSGRPQRWCASAKIPRRCCRWLSMFGRSATRKR